MQSQERNRNAGCESGWSRTTRWGETWTDRQPHFNTTKVLSNSATAAYLVSDSNSVGRERCIAPGGCYCRASNLHERRPQPQSIKLTGTTPTTLMFGWMEKQRTAKSSTVCTNDCFLLRPLPLPQRHWLVNQLCLVTDRISRPRVLARQKKCFR